MKLPLQLETVVEFSLKIIELNKEADHVNEEVLYLYLICELIIPDLKANRQALEEGGLSILSEGELSISSEGKLSISSEVELRISSEGELSISSEGELCI
ncbi:hypothetical protein Tco_1449015 [Tanacetum coccineum]